MAQLHLLVGLKTPDTVAMSARMALRDLLGHDELDALHREDYWRFEGDFDPGALLETLLAASSRFVNPSKHTHRVPASLEGLGPQRRGEGVPVGVLVRKLDDFTGRDAAGYCRRALGLPEVAEVSFATLWTLWLTGDEPRESARRIADCRARRDGLLANPHCESFKLLELSRE